MPVKCTRLKADGSPCLAPAMKNADVCFFHATNDDVKAAVKKQDEALDLATELKHELKRVQKAKGNPLEKAKLALEIMKILSQFEQKPESQPEQMSLKERIKSYRE